LPEKFSFKASLGKNGTMVLMIDNKEVGTTKATGIFKTESESQIRVGIDNRKGDDRVFNYPDSIFQLRANLISARLETLEVMSPAAIAAGNIDKTIIIKVLKDVMKYDKVLITAKAGTTSRLLSRTPILCSIILCSLNLRRWKELVQQLINWHRILTVQK
jgi:hypothetical protein